MSPRLPPGVTLYLARHGETVANVERRFQGRIDTPLTPHGREQARMLGMILAHCLAGRPEPRFVSSPLQRARTTTELILETLLLPKTYATDARLMEINLGAWEGLRDDEARALDPALWDARVQDKWNVRVPGGGENYAMVAERIESWVTDLNQDTVAVSHGALTRIFRGLFSGTNWQEMSNLDEPQDVVFRFRDEGVMRLEHRPGV